MGCYAVSSMALGLVDYTIVGAYLAGMIGLGLIMSSKIRKFKDYFLAGGALTTPLLICSLVSTYYELDVTFATSERSFYAGVVAWFWEARPYYVAIFLAAYLITGRLKRYRFMTLPDVLDHHYGRGARVAGALACFVYSLPITALAGMGAMFETLGWPGHAALATSLAVCATYTLVGGLWADTITDTVQFVLMSVSLAVAIPVALNLVGGFEFVTRLPAAHLTATGTISGWLILAWCCGALTVFVEPAFYQRIFAAKDAKAVRNALLVGVVLWAAYDWGVTLVGMLARAAAESGVIASGTEGRQALITICLTALPVGMKGLFVAGILAAAMSSVDSYSLLASGNVSYDIIRPLSAGRISDRALIRMTRGGVFAVMLAGLAVSMAFERIYDMWIFMASVMVAAVFVPVMGALFLKPKRACGLAASVAGLAALAIFHGVILTRGVFDPEEESYVWEIGRLVIWREYSVLFALPASALGYAVAQFLGRE